MKRISGGQLSRKAKATLLSSHAEGPRTAAGDTSFTGQAKAVDTAVESQPAASPRTYRSGRTSPPRQPHDFDSDSSLGLPLSKKEMLVAVGRASADEVAALATLVDAGLLLPRGDRLEVRHRVIAEVVTAALEKSGELFAPYMQLTEALALEYEIDRPHSRLTKLVKELLNYERLYDMFTADDVRRFYGKLQQLLNPDYHFWLQRGAYEVKHGSLVLAANYLERARGLGGHDYRVNVEYAYFLFRVAQEEPVGPDAEAGVREAEEILVAVMNEAGDRNPYPYHVLLTEKLKWLRLAPRTKEQRVLELQGLLGHAEEGVQRHRGYRMLTAARAEVKRELLMQAVDTTSKPRPGRRRRQSQSKSERA